MIYTDGIETELHDLGFELMDFEYDKTGCYKQEWVNDAGYTLYLNYRYAKDKKTQCHAIYKGGEYAGMDYISLIDDELIYKIKECMKSDKIFYAIIRCLNPLNLIKEAK